MVADPADAARLTLGFSGTALFAPRFLVRWIIGKMKGQIIMPVGFQLGGRDRHVGLCHPLRNPRFILG
jgi:hypothetical protein